MCTCFPTVPTAIPELTLKTLTVELKLLTDPIQFGIHLNIPQVELTIIQRNHPLGKV